MKKIKNFLIIAMILVLLSIFVFAEVQYGEDLFPEDGEYINISSPAFNFNATSNVSSILTCSLYIGGSINQTNSSVQNNTITSISATNPFEDGTYEWFISCTDDDGTINTSTRNITIDTVPPNVTSITFSHPVIISDNIGEFYTIDITFSEPMNQDESISNMTPPNFTSSIAVLGQIFTDCSNSEWIANNIYRYNCTIADVEYFNDEINFTVNQGFDLAINQQLLNFSENMLIVDTIPPYLSFQDNTTWGNLSQDWIYVSVNASEANNMENYSIDLEGNISGYIEINDTSNYNFTSLTEGIYNITIWANDTYGNEYEELRVVILDTTPPIVNILMTDLYGPNTWNDTHSINGNFSDELAGVHTVTILINNLITGNYWNGTAWNESETQIPVNIAGNNWTYALDSSNFNDDSYNVTVFAIDSAGNSANESFVFEYDSVSPEANMVNVLVNPVYEGNLTQIVVVNFSKEMNTSVDPIITLGGSNWGIQNNVSWDLSNTTFTANFTHTGTEEILNDVDITINGAVDLAGNVMIVNISENKFNVDTVKPTLSGVIIQSNNVEPYLAKIGDIVTLNFTSSEPIDDVVVTMNGFVAVVTNSTSTSWSATREMNSSDDNGVVEFAINFNDLIGNSGLEVTHITDGVNVTLDKQQPTYVVSYIEGYQYVKNGTTLTINVTFSENISELPIPQISLIGDAEGLEATNLTRVSPTFYTYNWIVGLGNGEMMPEVTLAQDLAGNTVTNEGSTRTNITVDNTPPAINTVVLEDDNMICALPGRTNLNNELVLKANVTDDLSGTNSVIAFYQNVSNNITMDFEPDMEDISSGTLITGETFVNLTYNATTELWELILPLTNTTDAEYDSRVLVIVALDELGNQITSDPEVLIFYDFESPPMFDPCDRNGESTTNFCDIQDWTNVDYTFSLEKLNNESMCGEELPWEEDTWFKVFEVTFFGLDFTQNIEQLFELGSAIVPRITPPGEFGDSYIFVNSTKFEELNVTANISFWGLPFSAEPNITGSQEVSNISFILDTPFNITIDECEFWDDDEFDFENFEDCDAKWNHSVDRERYFSYFVPNGTLQFTVAGFSQYDISDTEIPIIEFVKPIDSTIYNGSLEELVFIVNGTGSQVAQIETYIYDELIGTIDYEDIYLSDEYCTNNQSTPDTVTCTLPFEGYEDGEYVFTVVALDFGGEEGNVAQENITYVYDTTIPELTIMSPTNAKYYNGQVVIINLLATDNLDMSLTTICVLSNSTHEINNSLIHGDNLKITSLPVENYTLNCTSTDHAGNTESVEVEFEVVNSESEGEELIFYSNEEYFLDNETTYSVLIIPVNNSLELIHIKEEFENDSYLDVSQLRGSDGVVRFVSGKNLTIVRSIGGHNYTFFIPNGTTLRPENESWDGKLLLPKISDGSYSVSGGDVEFVLELGADFRIDFEEPVLIIIEGVSTDAKAGWTRTGTALTKITTICNDKDAPTNVPEGGMCYLNENGNMYIWTYHFTIFGSYTLSSESSSSSSSSSSGPVNFVSVSDTFFEQGFNRWMLNGQGLRFNVGGNQHSLTVNSVSEGGASVTVASSPQTRTLSIGESWKVNVNGDEFYDVLVTLEDIDGTRVLVKIQQLEELVIPFVEPPVVDIEEELVEEPVVEQPPVVDSEPIVAPQDEPIVAPQDEPGRVLGWLFWVVIVLIVVIIIFMVVNSKKNN